MSMRTVTIEWSDGNDFAVREGDRECARLCWEEMLGQIATITHPAINEARFPMLTKQERQEREARWASTSAAIQPIV